MNIKRILQEFLKKNGTKCYVFCQGELGTVQNAIISERKPRISCDKIGKTEQTEYDFLFCATQEWKEKLKQAGHVIANGQRFLVVGLKTEVFMGEVLYVKAICRREGCL